jgi:NAD(P)-dependent dehydrogenase (short-subunit alcohol dehydrogenase family)
LAARAFDEARAAMVSRGRGAIVNNATVEAFRGVPYAAAYAAFNAGVVAFTRSLAVDVAQHGIRVNAIAPDLADTPQTPAELMLRRRDPTSSGPGYPWAGSASPTTTRPLWNSLPQTTHGS